MRRVVAILILVVCGFTVKANDSTEVKIDLLSIEQDSIPNEINLLEVQPNCAVEYNKGGKMPIFCRLEKTMTQKLNWWVKIRLE